MQYWRWHNSIYSRGAYAYIGGFDEIFIYDYENEKHYGMHISDATRNYAGYVYADPDSRNQHGQYKISGMLDSKMLPLHIGLVQTQNLLMWIFRGKTYQT